jgi:hypothetical protein
LVQIYSTTACEIVKLKVYVIWMLIMQIIKDERCEASQSMKRFPFPQRLPPYERSNFMIYLMGALTAYSNPENKISLLRALIRLFYPSENDKKYISNYESNLHCNSSAS